MAEHCPDPAGGTGRISQVLALSSVEATEPALECSCSKKLCSCAVCQEAQDFSSIQGSHPKSTEETAAPIINF